MIIIMNTMTILSLASDRALITVAVCGCFQSQKNADLINNVSANAFA